MNNPYLKKIIENNKDFLAEVEIAILDKISKNFKISGLILDLGREFGFLATWNYDNDNIIHICCSGDCEPKHFEPHSLHYYSHATYNVNFKEKSIYLESLNLQKDLFTYIKIDDKETKFLNTSTGSGLIGDHENKITYIEHSTGFKDKEVFEDLKFYKEISEMSKQHPQEIYEYLFLGKNCSLEIRELINLSCDLKFDFDSIEHEKYRMNIEEYNLDYRKKDTQQIENKNSIKNK